MNRASRTRNGVVTNYDNSPINQYTSATGQTLGYDANFNLSGMNGSVYNHDSANRLTSVSGNGHSASFTYDGLGRCVRRTVDGQTRIFTYDGWNPFLEWDGAANLMAWNAYGPNADEILARYDFSRGPLLYKQDKQGNVKFILNGSSQVIEKYAYDAFGKPTIRSGGGALLSASAVGNRFMYTGREYLAELGFYDYRNRYYQADLGRFLQTDPTGFDAGDMNLFRYCGDDPVDGSDPTGLVDTRAPGINTSLSSFGGGDWDWFNGRVAEAMREELARQGGVASDYTMATFSGPAALFGTARRAAAKDSASVVFNENVDRKEIPAADIPRQPDPGVDERTRSYTLPIKGPAKVYTNPATGKTSVVITVSVKQRLPIETRAYDAKEQSQLLRVILSIYKADFAVRELAAKGFADPVSGAAAVDRKAMEILKKENSLNIIDTDIHQRW